MGNANPQLLYYTIKAEAKISQKMQKHPWGSVAQVRYKASNIA